MTAGRAFPLSAIDGNPVPGADIPGSVPVFKRWLETEQGGWLVEAIEYSAAQSQLAALPPSLSWPSPDNFSTPTRTMSP